MTTPEMENRMMPSVSASTSIRTALRTINEGRAGIAVVVDDNSRVLATISDGDVRRGLLAGAALEDPVSTLMHADPATVPATADEESVLRALREHGVSAVPLVDAENRLVAVRHLRDFNVRGSGFAAAVVMAGGEGKRLRPLTEETPKPLVPVAGRPIIEYTMEKLARSGVSKVHVSVNYMADKIQDHLGDGSAFGTDIDYLIEREKLGTAGALRLLPEQTDGPILVMNADILSGVDVDGMVAQHTASASAITVGVVDYRMQIPYGVIQTENENVTGILEKPTHRVHINAGIYAVDPQVLSLIPADTHYDMTDLIADALAAGRRVQPFLIHEHWLDIGSPDDLNQAHDLVASLRSQDAEAGR